MSEVVTDGLLAAALAKLQADLPRIAKSETGKVEGTTKDGKRYSYEYSYADLAGISAAIMPLLGANELAFIAKPTYVGERFVLAYSLLHSSGEREDGEYPLPQTGTPQAIGSAITYARRYCLCAVTGVAPEDDDDDAAAAQAQASQFRQQQPAAGIPRELTAARDKVKASWDVTFGWNNDHPEGTASSSAAECAEFYARWDGRQAQTLWDADPAELRRYAAFLASLPSAVAGEDPANVPAGASAEGEESEAVDSPRPMTTAQRTKLHALLSPLYGRDRQARLGALSALVGRPVESSNDLTFPEAHQVIDELERNEREANQPAQSSSGADVHAEATDAADGTPADQKSGTPRTGEAAPDDPTTTEGD